MDEDGFSDYILLSFENSDLPTIGTYWNDKDGKRYMAVEPKLKSINKDGKCVIGGFVEVKE